MKPMRSICLCAVLTLGGVVGFLRAGDPPVQTHAELTARWRQEDYDTTLTPGTCAFCAEPDRLLVTPQGCGRHYPEDVQGVCAECLTDPGFQGMFLAKGLAHDHALPDGTRHTCLVTCGTLIDFLEDAATRADQLNAQRRFVRKRLARARSRSQLRRLRQQARSLEAAHREDRECLRVLQSVPFREAYETLKDNRERLDRLESLCRTCGRHPRHLHTMVKSMAAVASRKLLWPQPCPACESLRHLADTRNCSMIACDTCLEMSGEVTKFCTVCRRTLRGTRVAYPGKPGMNHEECIKKMVEAQDDPGAEGLFDLCPGHDGTEAKGDGKAF